MPELMGVSTDGGQGSPRLEGLQILPYLILSYTVQLKHAITNPIFHFSSFLVFSLMFTVNQRKIKTQGSIQVFLLLDRFLFFFLRLFKNWYFCSFT